VEHNDVRRARKTGLQSNMGSVEPIKLLCHFQGDQLYDFWLKQPKTILILWTKSVHLVRCAACPIHRIALRTAPARVNGFDAIK